MDGRFGFGETFLHTAPSIVERSRRIGRTQKFWAVVATKFQQEQRAAHHIERQGHEFYAPMTKVLARTGERRERLFPGYIFVLVDPGYWRHLSSTRGVHRLYTQNEIPSRVPDAEINYFKELEDRDGFVVLPSPVGTGSDVTIQSGPHAGLRGIVSGMDPQFRCRILSRLLGREVEVTVDRRALALS